MGSALCVKKQAGGEDVHHSEGNVAPDDVSIKNKKQGLKMTYKPLRARPKYCIYLKKKHSKQFKLHFIHLYRLLYNLN